MYTDFEDILDEYARAHADEYAKESSEKALATGITKGQENGQKIVSLIRKNISDSEIMKQVPCTINDIQTWRSILS